VYLRSCYFHIYSLPSCELWVDGFQFGILSDNRLRSYNPDPAEWYLPLAPFVISLFSCGCLRSIPGQRAYGNRERSIPKPSARRLIVLFSFFLTGYFFILEIMLGVNYNITYESEKYSKNVSAFADLPLLLLTISGRLWGILFLFKLALLYMIMADAGRSAGLRSCSCGLPLKYYRHFLLKEPERAQCCSLRQRLFFIIE